MTGLAARLRGRRGTLELDAALQARPGEVTALSGPSGSGKTTLLRALAGLERLEGEVRVDGEAWQAPGRFVPPHRRPLGLVFQGAPLLPHLSVESNLRYGWRRSGAPAAALDRAVALTGAAPLLARSPDRLSGGERQRVAVARALACAPRLVLLDEPLTGLDAQAKVELLPALRRALAGLDAPVLYVSHDRSEVAALADRVVRIQAGRTEPEAPSPPDGLEGLGEAEVRRLAAAALRAGL